jgi:hypothetical protein
MPMETTTISQSSVVRCIAYIIATTNCYVNAIGKWKSERSPTTVAGRYNFPQTSSDARHKYAASQNLSAERPHEN